MQPAITRGSLDVHRLIRAALLAGNAVLIGKLFLTGQMVKYMSPALDPLTALAAVVLLAMALVEVRQALARPSHDDCHAVGDHDHSQHEHDHDHGHHHATSASEAGLTYLLVIGTLALGMALTPRALSASALGGEDLASHLLAIGPRSDTTTAQQVTPVALIDDITALVARAQLVGDGIAGQPVRIIGLTAPSGGLEAGEFAVLRYTVVHCVADARPFGLIVAAETTPPVNQWMEIEGRVAIRDRQGNRLLAIEATSVRPIAEPENPYIRPVA
jgi:uncharacterized repeat protein (TIGR03943 family)